MKTSTFIWLTLFGLGLTGLLVRQTAARAATDSAAGLASGLATGAEDIFDAVGIL